MCHHASPKPLHRRPAGRLKRRAGVSARSRLRQEKPRSAEWSCRRCAARTTGPARLGFTVTKKVGNAVVRNRTRRRLKEAARLLLAEHPVAGVDLVLIGRDSTRKRNFIALQDDIRRALDRTGV